MGAPQYRWREIPQSRSRKLVVRREELLARLHVAQPAPRVVTGEPFGQFPPLRCGPITEAGHGRRSTRPQLVESALQAPGVENGDVEDPDAARRAARAAGQRGTGGAGALRAAGVHRGQEPPLVGEEALHGRIGNDDQHAGQSTLVASSPAVATMTLPEGTR